MDLGPKESSGEWFRRKKGGILRNFKKNLNLSLDLSKVPVVDRFRYRATIQIQDQSQCFDWRVEPVITGQAWLELSTWVGQAIKKMLGEQKFSQIEIHQSNGGRGQELEDPWIDVATGILKSELGGHLRRGEKDTPPFLRILVK